MIRTLKIYTLSNFQTYNAVLLTVVTVPYITFPKPVYFITESVYLQPCHPLCPSPTSGSHPSVLWISELLLFVAVFGFHVWVRLQNIRLSLSDILHSRSIHVVTNGNAKGFDDSGFHQWTHCRKVLTEPCIWYCAVQNYFLLKLLKYNLKRTSFFGLF